MLKAAFAGFVITVSGFSNAGFITFNDRVAFDAYVGTTVVDDLESVGTSLGGTRKTVDSGDFSWTMQDYNCEDGNGCSAQFGSSGYNGPMMQSAGDDFIWTYTDGMFMFASGISSFGIQFGAVDGFSSITLNGLNSGSQAVGSFFGIASDDNTTFTSVTYSKSRRYGAFDDVTYSRTNQMSVSASEPATLAILALGLFGLGARRFKK